MKKYNSIWGSYAYNDDEYCDFEGKEELDRVVEVFKLEAKYMAEREILKGNKLCFDTERSEHYDFICFDFYVRSHDMRDNFTTLYHMHVYVEDK